MVKAIDISFLKPIVANVLEDENRNWTIQGFGFLRTYFGTKNNPKRYRLNLWDNRFTIPNVSTIHDHPWDFKSVIIAGEFLNQRYELENDESNPTHNYTILKTGEGGGLTKTDPKACKLIPYNEEFYLPGNIYSQKANEIHETKFVNGSVTLNERVGDTEHARVFWPYGKNWVDARPRVATKDEVKKAVETSLNKWF